ncbi:AzlD domain-containing protein [Citrobacter sp. JGM124]|uniref:AzlD domain-containing protein n=1 Tax=Citrobacter sp. JGM124 TaxID=2799789 RepID=UPI001BA77CF5|nr:AzlD domain-containing protein [Citrobacter sp. JGM124]MBS0849322.1 AzlD domain-containing protein [Citrobacter sp. JGM124]
MMSDIILAIILCAVLTALMRTLPVILLSRFRLAITVRQWLGFIPAAIMSALIAAELITKPALTSGGISLSLIAALIATLAGALSRSLFITVISGMVSYSLLRYLFGVV